MNSQTTADVIARFPSAAAFLTDEVAVPYNRIVSQPEPGMTLIEPFSLPPYVRPFLTDEQTDRLSTLVEKECADLVDAIWFDEQHTRRGYLAVVFTLDCQVFTGDTCRDGDGGYEKITSDWRDTLTVRVHNWMGLVDIARAVASEVRGIEGIQTR